MSSNDLFDFSLNTFVFYERLRLLVLFGKEDTII